MQRDVSELARRPFDLLVIGGGIYGLTIACDAAGRGLTVALIEGDDFGSGASFNHLRTIHGGLRYLQSLDLGRARESLLERRTIAKIAPWAVRPMPFALPLASSLTRGRLAMRTGFLLDRLVAFDRNEGVPAELRLPAGTVVSPAEALQRFPELTGRSLTGAAIWYDYVTTEADRLTLAWAVAAVRHGAVVANHVQALHVLSDGTGVHGVRALDCDRADHTFDVQARVTVNATGPLMLHLGEAAPFRRPVLIKAMNLVTRLPAAGHAAGGRSASGRNLFLVPWRGRALFGTWESSEPAGHEAPLTARSEEVRMFAEEINQAFPSIGLRLEDVTLVHRALVAGTAAPGGRVTLEGRDQIEEGAPGFDGLIAVVGAKYTTARAVAQRVVDRVFGKLGRRSPPCRTAIDPLPDMGQSLHGDQALVRAVREEMAVTLRDALIRRVPLGTVECPGDAQLSHAAEIVSRERGWTSEKKNREIESVRDFYRIL